MKLAYLGSSDNESGCLWNLRSSLPNFMPHKSIYTNSQKGFKFMGLLFSLGVCSFQSKKFVALPLVLNRQI